VLFVEVWECCFLWYNTRAAILACSIFFDLGNYQILLNDELTMG
jgi:hypothetical protein